MVLVLWVPLILIVVIPMVNISTRWSIVLVLGRGEIRGRARNFRIRIAPIRRISTVIIVRIGIPQIIVLRDPLIVRVVIQIPGRIGGLRAWPLHIL